jgi:hypothetical protein
MIRHIVAFQLAASDAAQRAADAAGIKSKLEGLRGLIPGLISLEVQPDLGLVDSHWDLVLVGEHESNEALEAYQADPRHKEILAWVSTVVSGRAVVDYETS